LLACYHSIWII